MTSAYDFPGPVDMLMRSNTSWLRVEYSIGNKGARGSRRKEGRKVPTKKPEGLEWLRERQTAGLQKATLSGKKAQTVKKKKWKEEAREDGCFGAFELPVDPCGYIAKDVQIPVKKYKKGQIVQGKRAITTTTDEESNRPLHTRLSGILGHASMYSREGGRGGNRVREMEKKRNTLPLNQKPTEATSYSLACHSIQGGVGWPGQEGRRVEMRAPKFWWQGWDADRKVLSRQRRTIFTIIHNSLSASRRKPAQHFLVKEVKRKTKGYIVLMGEAQPRSNCSHISSFQGK